MPLPLDGKGIGSCFEGLLSVDPFVGEDSFQDDGCLCETPQRTADSVSVGAEQAHLNHAAFLPGRSVVVNFEECRVVVRASGGQKTRPIGQ